MDEEKTRKLVVLSVGYDSLDKILREVGKEHLVVGVYQLRNMPKAEEKRKFHDLLKNRKILFSGETFNFFECSLLDQIKNTVPLAAKTVYDERTTEEVLDEVVYRFQGVKSKGRALFHLSLEPKLMRDYFLK